MLIADALAAPSHWLYGGEAQIKLVLGGKVSGYMQVPRELRGSMMRLGGGESAWEGLIGDVLSHGKRHLWDGLHHYHCTLTKGETTLEGHMVRVAMRSLARETPSASAAEECANYLTDGEGCETKAQIEPASSRPRPAWCFEAERLRTDYVEWMGTHDGPLAHQDAYASSYHRLFFAARARGRPLAECPSSDDGVSSIEGLTLPAVVLLGALGAAMPLTDALAAACGAARVTRRSERVEAHVEPLQRTLGAIFEGRSAADAAQATAVRDFGARIDVTQPDPVAPSDVAVGWQSTLLLAAKHGDDFTRCLLANANSGGDNVHRLVLGALVGADCGASRIPSELKRGLAHAEAIEREIGAFVASRVKRSRDKAGGAEAL